TASHARIKSGRAALAHPLLHPFGIGAPKLAKLVARRPRLGKGASSWGEEKRRPARASVGGTTPTKLACGFSRGRDPNRECPRATISVARLARRLSSGAALPRRRRQSGGEAL